MSSNEKSLLEILAARDEEVARQQKIMSLDEMSAIYKFNAENFIKDIQRAAHGRWGNHVEVILRMSIGHQKKKVLVFPDRLASAISNICPIVEFKTAYANIQNWGEEFERSNKNHRSNGDSYFLGMKVVETGYCFSIFENSCAITRYEKTTTGYKNFADTTELYFPEEKIENTNMLNIVEEKLKSKLST